MLSHCFVLIPNSSKNFLPNIAGVEVAGGDVDERRLGLSEAVPEGRHGKHTRGQTRQDEHHVPQLETEILVI